MRIRTQLIVAFLLLAIVPLSGIVLYSYASSLEAVRRTAETEAGSLTQEMDGRMAAIRTELGRGVERVGEIPLRRLVAATNERGRPLPELGQLVLGGFGEAAPLLGSLEFVPVGAPPAALEPPSPSAVPPPPGAVVIDIPQILREAELETRIARRFEVQKKLQEQLRQLRAEAAAERGAVGEKLKEEKRREVELSLGRALERPVREDGKVVGTVKVRVRGDELLRRVLARTRRGEGEVPFALDAEGRLFAINEEDRTQIEALPLDLPSLARQGSAREVFDDWVVVTSKDAESGLTFGIARSVPLEEVRRAAARSFGWGLGLIGLALLGILPLSARMSRQVNVLTEAAERISHGDLETRVPVRSRGEMGKLALAFNRMAHDLREHQEHLLEEERLRKEREVEQRLLKTEYERKTGELEEARKFQLSLLPKTLPLHPAFEIAVSMRTATEVGGDYYDFHLSGEGILTAAIGDATGHGARAGTMVTAIKSLFTARAAGKGLSRFLGDAAGVIKRMDLGRMAMALSVIRLEGRALSVSAAGMPPVLLFRRKTGRVEEIALPGMPLGGLAFDYQETGTRVEPGDAILLMTDGLPELGNPEGEPLGYPRVRSLFEGLGTKAPAEIIAGLTEGAESWAAGEAARDDVTLVVIKVS